MKTKHPKILILGGGYAGLLAAARLSRSKRPLDITLIDGRERFEQRIRYHEALAGRQPKTLNYRMPLKRRGVRFQQGWVEALDTNSRTVSLREGSEEKVCRLNYDYLVLAMGSQVAAPVPGVEEYAWRPESIRKAEQVRPALEVLVRQRGHLAVVGGGLTALETATELKERYPDLNVSLISRCSLESDWSKAGHRHLRAVLNKLGIRVVENRKVERVNVDELVCFGNERISMDRCIWAAGFQPSPLAEEAGLPTDEQGRVLTDDTLQVAGHDRLFVAGDLSHVYGGRVDSMRMGCVTAMPQGAQAGDNLRRLLNGQPMQPLRFGYFFRCVSLGRREGLIQYVNKDDQPLERINRGRLAVWIKESICRMTYLGVKWELNTGWPLYQWPRPAPRDRPENGSDQTPSSESSP